MLIYPTIKMSPLLGLQGSGGGLGYLAGGGGGARGDRFCGPGGGCGGASVGLSHER